MKRGQNNGTLPPLFKRRRSGIPSLLCGIIIAAWLLRPAPEQQKLESHETKDHLSFESCQAAPEMILVEVCSPDDREVYCSFTKREEIYALISAQPDINDTPEESITKAEEAKSASSTSKELNSLSSLSFLIRFTNAKGEVFRYLITEDASLYSAELYHQGWNLVLPEDAAALIQKLNDLGWEMP